MKLNDLLPIGAGAAAIWVIFWWREMRDRDTRAAATPTPPAVASSAPAASGAVGDTLESSWAPSTQFPGTFDEFSEGTVAVGGDLPMIENPASPPTDFFPEQLVNAQPISYTDEVSAMPVAKIEDVGSVGKSSRTRPWLPRTEAPAGFGRMPVGTAPPRPASTKTSPRLEPDHRDLPRREAEVAKPAHRRDSQPAPRPQPKAGAGVNTLAQWRAKYR